MFVLLLFVLLLFIIKNEPKPEEFDEGSLVIERGVLSEKGNLFHNFEAKEEEDDEDEMIRNKMKDHQEAHESIRSDENNEEEEEELFVETNFLPAPRLSWSQLDMLTCFSSS